MVRDSGDRIIQHDSTEIQNQVSDNKGPGDKVTGNQAPDILGELLKGCARRDELALSQLYRGSAPQLFALLVRWLKVRSYAEEALQNTFSIVWHHAGDYRSDLGSPMLWMQGIARVEARKISSEQKNWQAVPDDSILKPLENVSLPVEIDQLDIAAKQDLYALYCEGFSLQCLADKSSEPAADIRNRVREALRQISGSADESA